MTAWAPSGHDRPRTWGNLSSGPKDPTFRLGGRPAAEEISARMQERWTAFAHGEGPNPRTSGAPLWSPYETSSAGRQRLVIDRRDTVVPDLDGPLRAAWGDEVLDFC